MSKVTKEYIQYLQQFILKHASPFLTPDQIELSKRHAPEYLENCDIQDCILTMEIGSKIFKYALPLSKEVEEHIAEIFPIAVDELNGYIAFDLVTFDENDPLNEEFILEELELMVPSSANNIGTRFEKASQLSL